MSYLTAMMNLYIACHSLLPNNITGSGTTMNVPPETSNILGLMNLYITCQYFESQYSPNIPVINFGQTPTNNNRTTPSIDPRLNFQTSSKTLELPLGYTGFVDIRSAYKVYELRKSWNEARKYCLNKGANLAVTNSMEKIRHVLSLFGNSNISIWIGFHKLFDSSEWVELKTGKSAASFFNNSEMIETSNKCAVISKSRNGLSVGNCEHGAHFVCEIPI